MSLSNQIKAFFGISVPVISVVFFSRLILDIGSRMVFPFIPQLATGLGLSVVGFGWLIFARSLVGVTGPFFGIWADQYGRRKLMAVGLLFQAAGIIGFVFSQGWQALLPMLLFGLGLTAFQPPQQAYISDQVAYNKRGRALAIVEASWAIAAIIFLPIVGWLIDAFGWRFPFFGLSLFSLIGAGIVWRYLPPTEHQTQTRLSWPEMGQMCLRPNILAAITVALLLFVAVDCFVSVWGIWLSSDYGLGAATLGLVATGIGLAELAGSGSSSIFIDRIGKRRGSGLGLLLTALVLLLLPLTRSNFPFAVITLIVTGTLLEFTIVSMMPLYSEQAPEARATMFALILLGASIGGALGAPIATRLWETSGLGAVCLVAAGCLLLALGLVWKFLEEETFIPSPLDS